MKIKLKKAGFAATVLFSCLFGIQEACFADDKTPVVENDHFTIIETDISDYTFSAFSDGKIVYYKIILNKDLIKTNTDIVWEEVETQGENTITIKMPHNGEETETKFYKYTYTYASGRDVKQNNNKTEASKDALGAALNVSSDTSLINSDFIKNTAKVEGEGHTAAGGAIYNSKKVEDVVGAFINNTAEGAQTNTNAKGGAINNTGEINHIVGDFIDNSVKVTQASSSAKGGAISSENGKIGSIGVVDISGIVYPSNFIGNYAYAEGEGSSALGGAIAIESNALDVENPDIGYIAGNFKGNYAYSKNGLAAGGAIYGQNADMGIIAGNFIGNYAYAEGEGSSAMGGAIHNVVVTELAGNFIGNYAKSTNGEAVGGALSNVSTNNVIKSSFIGNNVSSNGNAKGGAIYGGEIKSFDESAFMSNYAKGSLNAEGGAIYHNSNVNPDIKSNFGSNYAVSSSGNAKGGAIYNSGNIKTIDGKYTGNYSSGANISAGGAIYNAGTGTIETIKGDFKNNYTKIESVNSFGGAIYNEGTINNIESSNFTSNSVGGSGGAIYNKGTIGTLNGNFENNLASGNGGAIYNEGNINQLTGNFKGGFAAENGGAIYNKGNINQLTGNFTGNHASENGGVIYNKGTIEALNGNFENNFVPENGAAIYNEGKINKLTGNFTGNTTLGKGAAIYNANSGNINIIADPQDVVFKGNFIITESGVNPQNDIHNEGTINLYALPGRNIEFNGTITDNETPTGTLNVGAANSGYAGTVHFNNAVRQKNINLNSGTLNMGVGGSFNNDLDLSLNGGTLNFINRSVNAYNVGQLNLNGDVHLGVDVDLKNKAMDTIGANTVNANGGSLYVSDVRLLSETKDKMTNINFTKDEKLKGAVRYAGKGSILGPIFKYDASYNSGTGDFAFTRASSGTYKDFNPSIVAAPVAAQAGAYVSQLTTFDKAFRKADAFMSYNKQQRQAMRDADKYALVDRGDYTVDPNMSQYKDAEAWFSPYTTFEKVPLKHGPKVSNISYGALIGGDSKFLDLSNGASAIVGGYIGYNGAHQRYDGVSIYENGGSLGLTGSIFKGNFFTSLVINAGLSGGNADGSFGDDDFMMFMTGIASKTGYNIELFDGKLIIQPNYTMSYSFVNTSNYTNDAGVRIKSDPLNVLHIEPGLKIIGNTKRGWQPYLGVSFVMNPVGKTKAKANDVSIPSLSVKPYVKYGLGIRQNWKDSMSCFCQAFATNGGRNGVGLQAGFTSAVGKRR